ncbi:hypothetical protein PQR21_30200 [Paraburkholderia nemoris]|uniref:hypothetical protein n=1 Tax=Paraburkholderia nemoris TaxID=2793076 RepID=UPI0038BA9F19
MTKAFNVIFREAYMPNWNSSALLLVPIIAALLAICAVITIVPIPSLRTFIPPILIIAGLTAILMIVTILPIPGDNGNIARAVYAAAVIAVMIMWMRGQIA